MRAILQELVYDAAVGGAVWPFDRHYIRPPHFHGQVEFLLVRRGTATVHLGTRSERLRAGQLYWILPCLPHVMSGFSADFDMSRGYRGSKQLVERVTALGGSGLGLVGHHELMIPLLAGLVLAELEEP